MPDSDQCYIALDKAGRCVGLAALEPAAHIAKVVLEWESQGLSVEVTTQIDGKERLFAGLIAVDEATG